MKEYNNYYMVTGWTEPREQNHKKRKPSERIKELKQK